MLKLMSDLQKRFIISDPHNDLKSEWMKMNERMNVRRIEWMTLAWIKIVQLDNSFRYLQIMIIISVIWLKCVNEKYLDNYKIKQTKPCI